MTVDGALIPTLHRSSMCSGLAGIAIDETENTDVHWKDDPKSKHSFGSRGHSDSDCHY